MPSLQARIFVSYRRDDTSGYAGSLARALIRRFGRDDVFIDLTNIDGGEDFERKIKYAVERCHVLLVIISPQWVLRMKDTSRRLRAKNKKNWVRLEIEAALRSGVHIVPVLVHGAQMPSAQELPNSLSALSQIHGMEISDLNWETDLYKIIKRIEELFDVQQPAPQPQEKREVLYAAPPQQSGPPVSLGSVIFHSIVRLYRAAILLAVAIIIIVLWNYPQKARGIFESVQDILVSPKPTPSPFRRNDTLPTPTFSPFRVDHLLKGQPTSTPSPVPSKGIRALPEK